MTGVAEAAHTASTAGALAVDLRVRVGTFTLEAALAAQPGEVLAVLGPNGSGKSTLLGAIAGQRAGVEGTIALGGRTIPSSMPPEQRRIGLLGQRPLLFPHLTALENVAFGPRAQGIARAEARRLAARHLDDVDLGELADRRPAQLSGGQQQRVALARALAARPDALLLDEPFAALDAPSASQGRRLIGELRDRIAVPLVLVTHDAMDAVVLAARTVVLEDGRIAQQGETAQVLSHPDNPFVAAIAGVNLVVCGADRPGPTWAGVGGRVERGASGTVVFAPGAVRVHALDSDSGGGGNASAPPVNTWTGTIAAMTPVPGGIRLTTLEQPDIAADCPSPTALALRVRPGTRLTFSVAAEDVSVRGSA